MMGVECMVAYTKWRMELDSDGNTYKERSLNDEMLYIGMSANAVDCDIEEVGKCYTYC